jgi:hypothetical protein
MSTRGYIIVKVKESDKGNSLSFDREKLANGISILDEAKWNGDGFDPLTDDIWKQTEKVTADFLAIYSQCDNYPTGTGLELLKHYNSYEQAMNLVAGGLVEQVCDSKILYCKSRRDSWQKTGFGEITPMQCAEPSPCESYQYLFFNGRWYVRQWGSGWYDLEQLLALGDDADRDLPDLEQYHKVQAMKYHSKKRDKAWDAFEKVWNAMLPVGSGLCKVPEKMA